MTQALDLRLMRITVNISGKSMVFETLAMTAAGTKYVNPLKNDCEITLSNLDKTTQDFILTETTPYNLNNGIKTVLVEAGRESYGLSKIYSGNIITSYVTQPPDINVVLKCLTGFYLTTSILALNFANPVTNKQLMQQFAEQNDLSLQFEANLQNFNNYSWNGDKYGQLIDLAKQSNSNIYIDDNKLVVKNHGQPLKNQSTRILNAASGMIGIPQFTEWGIKVKFLLDNQTILGSGLTIKSDIYPAINGTYVIYKLSFEIANRDTPFYYVAEATRLGIFPAGAAS